MTAIYQQNLIKKHFPYNVIMTNIQDYPPHWHEEYEIIYNCDEPFEMTIGDEVVKLERDDIYIVEPRAVHAFLFQKAPRYRLILQFAPMAMKSIEAFDDHLKLSKKHWTNKDGTVYDKLRDAMMTILEEEKAKEEAYEYACLSKLYEIMALIMRQMPMVPCSEKELTTRQKKMTKLQMTFDFIDANYHKKITLKDIAGRAGYSTYYFTRFFKEMTGMTFNDYLSNYRILIATRQLLETDYSITEISLNAGFSSIKTFNRVFKDVKLCSPSDYRKLGKK